MGNFVILLKLRNFEKLKSKICLEYYFGLVIKIWYEKLGHLNLKTLRKLSNASAVRGLPKLGKQSPGVCGSCQYGNQIETTHKVVQQAFTTKVLERLHKDLIGLVQVESITDKKYIFVCVDNFSRFTWVNFIRAKPNTFDSFKNFCIKLINNKNCNIGKIVRIRSDHSKEFENSIFADFYNKHGISHECFSSKTP